ncbi:MAG TPA: DASS family sodium-coupled anion symporter [Patescibacteria group bacterium]|nr:DASS family sodium-coupled anion symporter [Patescibacteria group bacterium]
MSSRLRFSGRFIAVLLITGAVLLLPTPQGLTPEGKRAMAAFVFTGAVFALQPVSLPFASLMVSVALVSLGVADVTQAFETFSRPIITLILGSLFLAEALRKQGVTRRYALRSIVASGGSVNRILLGMMGIAALLSMWMENTATAAVLIPVALTIANQVKDRESAQEITVLLVLGIAYAASLGGMVTVTGSASNAVAAGFLTEIKVWTFLDWVRYGLPAFLVVFPITWWLLLRLVKVRQRFIDISLAEKELEDLGGLRFVEWEVLLTLGVTAVVWILGASIEPVLSLPPTVLSPAVVSMAAVAFLSLRGVIAWEDVKGVSWGMVFIIGAGLSLGETLTRTGATAWLSEMINPMISGSPFIVSLLVLVFASALLTNVINNTTMAAIFVPILINLARQDPSLNAVQLVLPMTLATTFGYSLPSASGRMALISATGIVKRSNMMRYGLIMTVASAAALVALFYTLTLLRLI